MRDQWPLKISGLQDIIYEGLEVKDLTLADIFLECLVELKKINLHLSLLNDEEIDNLDVEGE